MARSGKDYASAVRALRAAGYSFPASAGYKLNNAANWSGGQKSAVTRAFRELASTIEDDTGETADEFVASFYDDSAGDSFEEYDDIFYFDFAEAFDLLDYAEDDYEEDGG